MLLNIVQLGQIMPAAPEPVVDRYYQPILDCTKAILINTPLRMAHFLAQVGNETGDMRSVIENLYYSVEGLKKTWPSLFKTDADAQKYAYQPERIANLVYGNRYGNGDEASGDGWNFRGRGFIQLTFKANYIAYGRARGRDYVTPPNYDLVANDPETAVDVACWYWDSHHLNDLADNDNLIGITKAVNGGLIGFDNRRNKLLKAKQVLGIPVPPEVNLLESQPKDYFKK